MDLKRAMLSVFIFFQMAVLAAAMTGLKPKSNAANSTASRSPWYVPSEDEVSATSAVQIEADQGSDQGRIETQGRRRRRRKYNGPAASGWGTLIATIKNSPLCRAEFPDMELWGGSEGDKCRTKPEKEIDPLVGDKRSSKDKSRGEGHPKRQWSCPQGCDFAGDNEPRCVMTATREVCKIKVAIHNSCLDGPCPQVCEYPHEKLKYHATRADGDNAANDINMGDYCYGAEQNWFPPRGCEVSYQSHLDAAALLDIGMKGRRRRRRKGGVGNPVFPYTWLKGRTGWATGTPCHVDQTEIQKSMPAGLPPDNTIRGYWRNVATNTHGATASIQSGFSSSTSNSTTKDEKKDFEASISRGVSVTVGGELPGGAGSVSGTVGFDVSVVGGGAFSIAKTAASTISQSQAEMIKVYCPDEILTTGVYEGDSWSKYHALTTHSALSMEYLYQWVVGNSQYEAKTQHFRCHRTSDGVERSPQCPPQFCGNPVTNPFCVRFAGGQAGADPNCQR